MNKIEIQLRLFRYKNTGVSVIRYPNKIITEHSDKPQCSFKILNDWKSTYESV